MNTKTYYYTTTFDKQFRPFYAYSATKRSRFKGYIPCGIDTKYKGKHLSTISIMQMIHKLWLSRQYPKDIVARDCYII